MNQVTEVPFEPLADLLDKAGLNLCVPFSRSELADSMPEPDLARLFDLSRSVPAQFKTILLIGSAGKKLWRAMPSEYLQRENPVDEYSTDCVNRIFEQYLPDGSWQFLFPESSAGFEISLQELGSLAGWHNASPLGIGINEEHGLWFAYRAVLAIESDIAGYKQTGHITGESPCLSCDAKPCLSRCPAQALTGGGNPDLSACVSHRLLPASDCAATCLARLACPVAPQFKYDGDQIAYFYKRSLESAQRWVAQDKE